MSKLLGVILLCAACVCAPAQTSSPKYQVGTITAVTAHQNTAEAADSSVARYDVSVKVGNTVYVVLYTPPNGANRVEYSAGADLLVLVGKDILTFNSKLSGTTEVPILRRETLPSEAKLDWSRIQGQYFSLKLQNLSEKLSLTDDQQAKLQPILEQEGAEVGAVFGNPVLSRKDQLNRWKKIVQSSDAKIKPLLSQTQLDKLHSLREGQKQELKRRISEAEADKGN